MPRNGSDIYFIPPGTEGFPDTTIESEKYNNYIHDVETDLNRPRPISAGGTGANNAKDARLNMNAEVAAQLVTNYDSHVWENGSFWSPGSATGGPVSGHTVGGTCVVLDHNPDFINLEARDVDDGLVPGRVYVRQKKGGIWGPWTQDNTGVVGATPPVNPPDGLLWWDNIGGHLYVWYNDGNSKQWVIASPFSDPAQFLLKAGDTMEGTLKLAHDPVDAEHAANKRYVDNATTSLQPQIDTKVNRAGDTMTGPLDVNSTIHSSHTGGTHGTYYFGTSNDFLDFNGSYFAISKSLQAFGNLIGNGAYISTAGAPAQGAVNFGNTGSYILFDGTNWSASGGNSFYISATLVSGSTIQSNPGYFQSNSPYIALGAAGGPVLFRPYGATNSTNQVYVTTEGNLRLTGNYANFIPSDGPNGGFACKDGATNQVGQHWFNINWNGSQKNLYIDNTLFGDLVTSSDYRIKKDVIPLPSTWDAVKALRPIKYTQNDFIPPASKETDAPLFKSDDIERWGFIAHELQETLVESAAIGKKDQEDCVQSVNTMAVVAALAKALQEAMERIEELEARI